MHMTFWFDPTINNLLIYGCNITTIPLLLLTCFCSAGLAFLFEYIKLLQAAQKQKELVLRSKQLKTICPMQENISLIPRNLDKPLDLSLQNRAKLYACDAAIWLGMHNLGYVIMLLVMVYNFWLFLAVVIGGGIGYYVFGQRFMKINLENCAVIKNTYCVSKCGHPDPHALYLALQKHKRSHKKRKPPTV